MRKVDISRTSRVELKLDRTTYSHSFNVYERKSAEWKYL